MRLTVVLTDFYPAAAEHAMETLPRLAGLEWLLEHGARTSLAADPRGALAAAHVTQAGERPEGIVPAQLLRRWIVGAEPFDGAAWIATPVHLQAALDHVRMPRTGILRLAPAELAALARGFAEVFADTGLQLVPAGRQLLLEAHGDALRAPATTHDPATCLGADVRRGLPAGDGAPALRRLGAELEMWLHGHAVNAARVARGELSVSTLWLWGGPGSAPLPAQPAADSVIARAQVFADDDIVAALCALAGRPAKAVPEGFAELCATSRAAECAVVLSVAARSAADAPLARIEAQWLAPLAAALRSGRLAACTLLVGGLRCDIGAAGPLARALAAFMRWRPARPWWENFGAVAPARVTHSPGDPLE